MPNPPPTSLVASLPRPCLMGIVNLTPDSFSDGNQFADCRAAVDFALQLARHGAAIIDLGGESTRPGSQRVLPDEQLRRVLPVLKALRPALDAAGFAHVLLSIDTTQPAVAQAALDAGAGMLNDVSAGRDSADAVIKLAAQRRVPIVLMHMLGSPADMQADPRYADVVEEVLSFLHARAQVAQSLGLPREMIYLDPGIGFGKTLDHNLRILSHLERFVASGFPILLGVSRKSLFARLTEQSLGIAPGPSDRLGGSCAVTALAALAGVSVLRVHDVLAHRQALDITLAVKKTQQQNRR
ncbi:MAG: dihydropteroate synthase [Phycisphaeraceae bacterium]|nr:dihydropteroate synthase [Phycisphaeraceae bacterium]